MLSEELLHNLVRQTCGDRLHAALKLIAELLGNIKVNAVYFTLLWSFQFLPTPTPVAVVPPAGWLSCGALLIALGAGQMLAFLC